MNNFKDLPVFFINNIFYCERRLVYYSRQIHIYLSRFKYIYARCTWMVLKLCLRTVLMSVLLILSRIWILCHTCFVSWQITETQLTDIWFRLLGLLIRYRSSFYTSDAVIMNFLSAKAISKSRDGLSGSFLLKSKYRQNSVKECDEKLCQYKIQVNMMEYRSVYKTGRTTCHRLGFCRHILWTCGSNLCTACDELAGRIICY